MLLSEEIQLLDAPELTKKTQKWTFFKKILANTTTHASAKNKNLTFLQS